MNQSELIEETKKLVKIWENLLPQLEIEKTKKELIKWKEESLSGDFWNDSSQAQITTKKIVSAEKLLKQAKNLSSNLSDLEELIQQSDGQDLPFCEEEFENSQKIIQELKIKTLLDGEYDQGSAILTIQTGNGGQDAEDFSQMLLKMYLRWADNQGFSCEIIEQSNSEVGLKSATVKIGGNFAYGLLSTENGIHRLIRLSPFNAKNLRQTSFSRVEILPQIAEEQLEIDAQDLRIDVFRSSGAGGQSVNTTDSAVRITYLPLNLVVTCQNEKSQLQNKAAAMQVLTARLWKIKQEQHTEKLSELRGDQLENSFGSQIKTYTLQPYKLVKDHRTNFESVHPDKIFLGKIDDFIQSFLHWKSSGKN
jgi:peptide chain release factor 2